VLGGILASRLQNLLPSGRWGRTFWLSVGGTLQGYTKYLQLQADGLTPAVPIQGTIVARNYLPNITDQLAGTLETAGYNVTVAPYDWRFECGYNAAAILAANPGLASQPFAIVAHSMGGLIARSMWLQAGSGSGFQNNCKRIITLGTPHWGSYAVMQMFCHLGVYYNALAVASAPATLTPYQAAVLAFGSNPYGFLDIVVDSWPSVYELLPNIEQPNELNPDVGRPKIFVPANYMSRNKYISQPWMTRAQTYQALLTTPPSQPPAGVMVCVAGTGFATAGVYNGSGSLFRADSYPVEDGDGSVTVPSATLGSTPPILVLDSHSNLPLNSEVLGNVANWIENGQPSSSLKPPVVGLLQPPPDAAFMPQVDPIMNTQLFTPQNVPGNPLMPAACPTASSVNVSTVPVGTFSGATIVDYGPAR
jgi:hypothetical protein